MKKIIRKRNQLCSVADPLSVCEIPGGGYVAAGYPAETYNYIEERIDLNKYILGHKTPGPGHGPETPASAAGTNRGPVQCVWATNRHMTGQGIVLGDLIVLDPTKTPHKNSLVLCWWRDEFVVKKCEIHPSHVELIPLCEDLPVLTCHEEPLVKIGVVTHVVKKFPCHNNGYGGYPENAADYIENGMDFNTYIIGNNYWETLFYLWAAGDSMAGDGIEKGDLLVVDKLREPYDDSIIIFYIDRQFTLKRIRHTPTHVELVSSNPAMKPILLRDESEVR